LTRKIKRHTIRVYYQEGSKEKKTNNDDHSGGQKTEKQLYERVGPQQVKGETVKKKRGAQTPGGKRGTAIFAYLGKKLRHRPEVRGARKIRNSGPGRKVTEETRASHSGGNPEKLDLISTRLRKDTSSGRGGANMEESRLSGGEGFPRKKKAPVFGGSEKKGPGPEEIP